MTPCIGTWFSRHAGGRSPLRGGVRGCECGYGYTSMGISAHAHHVYSSVFVPVLCEMIGRVAAAMPMAPARKRFADNAYACVFVWVDVHVHLYMFMYALANTYTHTCAHTCIHPHMTTRIHAYIYIYMCACICFCMNTNMRVYVHALICFDTRAAIHWHSLVFTSIRVYHTSIHMYLIAYTHAPACSRREPPPCHSNIRFFGMLVVLTG